MQIEIYIDKIDSFLPGIAKQLNAEIENSILQLPKNLGEGYFTQLQFSKDMLISYYELKLNETTTIVRKKSENDNIIPIIFWISNSGITQELNAETKRIGKDTPNGIFLPSNRIETQYTFPSDILVKNITVFIEKDWLRKNIVSQNDYISNCILKTTNYFLFEEISLRMTEVLERIEYTIKKEMNSTLSRLNLYANTIKLAHLFFEKLLYRPLDKQVVNINPIDIEQIFKVKAIIMNNYVNIPSMDKLTNESGMNKRKMQKIFKQIFGKSIYQFALSIKMIEAKKMLQSKRYNVSEVGYTVGYTNLSHFTEKFKKYYGITPKSFLSSL